jgi:hypothetical protein
MPNRLIEKIRNSRAVEMLIFATLETKLSPNSIRSHTWQRSAQAYSLGAAMSPD